MIIFQNAKVGLVRIKNLYRAVFKASLSLIDASDHPGYNSDKVSKIA